MDDSGLIEINWVDYPSILGFWVDDLALVGDLDVEERRTDEERIKNGGKPLRICLRKHLGSVTKEPWL